MAKAIRLALAYDSYTVEGETEKSLTFAFESPPLARAAFTQHLAKAQKRKRLAAADATRTIDGLDPTRVQLAWDGDRVTRAWFTAAEGREHTSSLPASELVALALARPEFANLDEIGIGLERWQDSHKAPFDSVLDVLATARPALRALAFGDYDNRGGHILAFAKPARVAELYPQLARLRITTSPFPSLAGAELPALQSLYLRGNVRDADAFAALDRAWPALASCSVGWRRGDSKEALDDWRWLLGGERTPALRHLGILGSSIAGKLLAVLADSPLLARLSSLELRDIGDIDYAAKTLRKKLDAFKHVELRLPEAARIGGLEALRVAIMPSIDRYRDSRE